MTLRIIYFESAAGRGSFCWRDGAELGAGDEAAIIEVHQTITALRHRGRTINAEPLAVVLRDGDEVLVEVGATAASSGRATKVAIVAAVPDADAAARVATQAEQVLQDVGLVIDAGTLTSLLGRSDRRRARAGARRRNGLVWLVAAVAGAVLVYIVYRLTQRPPSP
jgi:hypothetical protein